MNADSALQAVKLFRHPPLGGRFPVIVIKVLSLPDFLRWTGLISLVSGLSQA